MKLHIQKYLIGLFTIPLLFICVQMANAMGQIRASDRAVPKANSLSTTSNLRSQNNLFVTPEPISTSLFLAGGVPLAARIIQRRRKT
jgi:hypothetical protein